MLFSTEFLEKIPHSFLPNFKKGTYLFYLFLLLGIIGVFSSLPFIYINISIKSTGITRPSTERTEVKPLLSGIIDTLFYKEGDTVKKESVILRIKDLNTKSKTVLNNLEISQRKQFVNDLEVLTFFLNNILKKLMGKIENIDSKLESSLYRTQYNRFIHQKREHELLLTKANNEVEMNTILANDHIISRKEFFDIQNNQERLLETYKAFLSEQQTNWLQDLTRYKLELSQYQLQLQQVKTDASYYEVKASTSGIIQGINTRYQGGLLQANETLCTISPEGELIGECYVPTRDIGLLKVGLPVRYQMDAFDYNYFGVLTGTVSMIDNDFTIINNIPVFKVRCSFNSTQFLLKNGFKGKIKKGLNFQARFIVARRSLWQLLFDKLDDWLNPNAPNKN